MKEERAVAVRRLLAFAVDWFVLVLWGGVIFGAVMIATGGSPSQPESPWTGQAMSLLWKYFHNYPVTTGEDLT